MIKMEMKKIDKLPPGGGTIGVHEIQKGIKSGDVKRVIVANNCPDWLIEKVKDAQFEQFNGNERELGTALGKPFAIAMVGYKE